MFVTLTDLSESPLNTCTMLGTNTQFQTNVMPVMLIHQGGVQILFLRGSPKGIVV